MRAGPAFLSLPWELLRDGRRDQPLALEMAGLNRSCSTDAPAAEKAPGKRLRVLMIIARPAGERDVGYRMIARPLLERLAPVAGEVDLEVLRPPTFEELRRRLAAARDHGEPFHVLHFDGHGTFGEQVESGAQADPLRYGSRLQAYLTFETETGEGDTVSAEVLGPVLAESPPGAQRLPSGHAGGRGPARGRGGDAGDGGNLLAPSGRVLGWAHRV